MSDCNQISMHHMGREEFLTDISHEWSLSRNLDYEEARKTRTQ